MNCKPGDLAFVIRDEFPENIGRVVEVLALSPPEEDDDGLYWDVRFVGAPGPYSDWDRPGVLAGYDVECCFLDGQLRPIGGIPVDEVQCDEVTA
ncbi:hypothetical protein B0G62_10475 [Paraburkholderia eburnea]|uniref:Uncharacterized protein n=1 Tax=Paraburkholderia eburnea TaxID=1189126 RepID=A0A2S4MDE6_9BURK|nr:hypothetical protein [Paraburkholderia eburnea]POR52778.1 hypothetical protein B0G62_10475 [Paraburkholderia eburnea]PRZ23646.1 hypothetical protein BX588_10475 [Paraburkholderia eburnea]